MAGEKSLFTGEGVAAIAEQVAKWQNENVILYHMQAMVAYRQRQSERLRGLSAHMKTFSASDARDMMDASHERLCQQLEDAVRPVVAHANLDANELRLVAEAAATMLAWCRSQR